MLKTTVKKKGASILEEFCQRTSLHGWNFCFREDRPVLHTIVWLGLIFFSWLVVGFLIYENALDFSRATVSYNLESPTVPLSEVFFPSIALCNMNSLRKSFILNPLKACCTWKLFLGYGY